MLQKFFHCQYLYSYLLLERIKHILESKLNKHEYYKKYSSFFLGEDTRNYEAIYWEDFYFICKGRLLFKLVILLLNSTSNYVVWMVYIYGNMYVSIFVQSKLIGLSAVTAQSGSTPGNEICPLSNRRPNTNAIIPVRS